MPHRITRTEALARLGRPEGCVPCAWARAADPILSSEHAVAVLSRFPIRWGHGLVVLRAHATCFSDVEPRVWADAAGLAARFAAALETVLSPARCYVASLGTSEPDLPMTFPHLHLNVIPVMERAARPREVLTWQHGVYQGTPEEWAALRASLERAVANR